MLPLVSQESSNFATKVISDFILKRGSLLVLQVVVPFLEIIPRHTYTHTNGTTNVNSPTVQLCTMLLIIQCVVPFGQGLYVIKHFL